MIVSYWRKIVGEWRWEEAVTGLFKLLSSSCAWKEQKTGLCGGRLAIVSSWEG